MWAGFCGSTGVSPLFRHSLPGRMKEPSWTLYLLPLCPHSCQSSCTQGRPHKAFIQAGQKGRCHSPKVTQSQQAACLCCRQSKKTGPGLSSAPWLGHWLCASLQGQQEHSLCVFAAERKQTEQSAPFLLLRSAQ